MSFARFSTDDCAGVVRGDLGEGAFTNESLNTLGGAGVVEIPRPQTLRFYICENGFEHHVATNFSTVAGAILLEHLFRAEAEVGSRLFVLRRRPLAAVGIILLAAVDRVAA